VLRYSRPVPPSDSVRARFAALVAAPDDAIDLTEAALLIAAEAYPGLDAARYVRMLDDLAAAVASGQRGPASDAERVRQLVRFLAVERGFRGNQDDYYDRRNSYLNEVLERRLGIPITLALVYMAVAGRLGLVLLGVGFPGHFLVKHPGASELVIDPFAGTFVDLQECARRLRAVLGPDTRLDPSHLRAATAREILVRMLRNLKQVYLQARELEPALACSERILLVEPGLAHELRDRGLLYEQLECFAAARTDLERFLALVPDDPSADTVRARLIEIGRHGATLH
jgi:regulator of sirC expression with transglutaminase-like and TPR domain